MPKFAANLSMMFNEVDFINRFKAAADAGFTAVEYLFPYDFDPDQIAAELTKHGLKQALFNLPPGDWAKGERGLAALPERRADFEASVARALPYIKATNVPHVHLMSGLASRADAKAMAAYKHAVRFACEAVASEGVEIVIEPINGRDMPGYFLNDFAAAAAIITELQLPNLKLQYDIYHRQILHGDVLKSLEVLMPMIGHIQIASVPKRNEPGTGELDDAKIFAHIDALGYHGWIGCEYRPAGSTIDGLGWFKRTPGSGS